MASGAIKDDQEIDVTQSAEDALQFDDDTLRGE